MRKKWKEAGVRVYDHIIAASIDPTDPNLPPSPIDEQGREKT
jgi:hypothetical protein